MDFIRGKINSKNLILIFLAVVLTALSFSASRSYRDWVLSNEATSVSRTLGIYRSSLESIINVRLNVNKILEEFVQARSDEQIKHDFPIFAPGIQGGVIGLRNIGIAQNGILNLIYPIRGNEQAIGYNLLKDDTPSVRADVTKAIQTKELVVSDPFQLRQGGLGMAGRKAIFKNNLFWGFVSVVVDIPAIVDYAGLEKGFTNISMALRDKTGNIFWGDPLIFNSSPVIQKINTTDGYWELAGIPIGGWEGSTSSNVSVFRFLMISFSVLIWIVVFLLIRKGTGISMTGQNKLDEKRGLKIVLIYAIVSTLYIIFSDRILLFIVKNADFLSQIQTVKGMLFVLLSSLIIYWSIEMYYGRYLVTERALRSILASGKLLAVAKTENELYQGICDSLVKEGGFDLAWVGLVHKDDGRKLYAAGRTGDTSNFLDDELIPLIDLDFGSTPCSQAIKSGKVIIINNIEEIGQYPEWHLSALKQDYKSMMAIPLIEGGHSFGVIALYSKKINTFSYGDLDLLSRYANDLVFGIRNLNLRRSREEAEQKFSNLFNAMSEGVAFYEYVRAKNGKIVNYRILEANPAYKKQSGGLDPSAIKGKLVTTVFKTKKPPYLKEYTEIIETKKPNEFETYFPPLKMYFYVSAVYLGDDRFSTIFQDITERKKLEMNLAKFNKEISTEKQRLEAILREMADAVFVTDANGKITIVNTEAQNISGYKKSDLVGHIFVDKIRKISERTKEPIKSLLKNVLENGQAISSTEPLLLINKKGKEIPIDEVATPLVDKDGKIEGAVVLIRDVTKKRVLDRMKTDFVSLASHQLRSPLTGIKWFVELLLSGVKQLPPDRVKDYIEKIGESNEKLIELVNDLLTTSRIEEGKYEKRNFEKVGIKKMLTDILNMLEVKRSGKNILVKGIEEIPDNVSVEADKIQISQVFANLIDNAINYSPKGSTIDITVEKKAKEVVIGIKDRGVGIPKDQRKRIFEKFFRGDNVSKVTAGSGLGLYMAKSIIEGHGGKISFESTEGKGTTFFVKLLINKPKKWTKRK